MRTSSLAAAPVLVALAVSLLGCVEQTQALPVAPEPSAGGRSGLTADPSAARLAAGPADASGERPIERNGLVWYEDAPEAAFAAARAAGKPVLLDLWAPWCHTCLSMQRVVMTAENLPEAKDRFVWLAIDTERASNASLLERLPVSVWPTFYVVDASDPSHLDVDGRWLGAASPGQFRRFLADSDRGTSRSASAAVSVTEAARLLAEADSVAAQGRHADAARAYASALERAPADWSRRPETLVAQITSLWKANDISTCLRVGSSGLSQTGLTASTIDFSSYALECAEAAQPGSSAAQASPAATTLRRAIALRLAPLCEQGSAELSPDDRADACDKLAQARASLGDADGAHAALLARLNVLERAAEGKSGEAALTYDWARTDALLQLGRPEDALAVATERERQLPQNYNPPHYRAKALKALRRWQEGLSAIERAMSLAYGPRKIGLMTLEADLLFGAGRTEDGVRTLEQQLALYRALPPGQRQPAAEARVEQRLRETAKPAAAPAPGR